MEKTAMQQLISLWEKLRDDKTRKNDISDNVYDSFIADAKLCLATEKRQIVEAHIQCVKKGFELESGKRFSKSDEKLVRKNIEEYYTKTFEQ